MLFNGRASTSYLASRLATGSPQNNVVRDRLTAVPIPHTDTILVDPHKTVSAQAPATGIEVPATFAARRVRVTGHNNIALPFVDESVKPVDQRQVTLRAVPNSFVPAHQLFDHAD